MHLFDRITPHLIRYTIFILYTDKYFIELHFFVVDFDSLMHD